MDACADERLHMYHTDARLSSYLSPNPGIYSPSTPGKDPLKWVKPKVSVQGVVALGGHFATLCRELADFYEA